MADTMDIQSGFQPHRPEIATEREARILREEAVIAKAEADIDAGLGIEFEEAEAWLAGLDDNPDAPPPFPRGQPAVR